MKKLVCMLFLLVLFTFPVYASAPDSVFDEQVRSSGAGELTESLPENTEKIMQEMGVGDLGENILKGFSVNSVLDTVLNEASAASARPIRSLGIVIGIILLTALISSTRDTLAGKSLHNTYNALSILAMMTAIVMPVVSCIDRAADVIEGAFVFMTAFVPVYAGIAMASGQAISGAAYNAAMFSISELISGGAGMVIIPVIKSALSLSLVSAISTKIKLDGIVSTMHKLIKWVLTFFLTVFTGVLGLNSAIGGAGDSLAQKSTKFVIGNFLPVVGGAISDAYGTVMGYVKILKSSVGAFGVIAALAIFLPVIIETILWLICLNICASVGGIFDNRAVESTMRAVCSTMEILLALLFCCLMILVVSTGIMLASTGGAV